MLPSNSAPTLAIPQVQINDENDDNDRTLTPETASELLQLRARAAERQGGDNVDNSGGWPMRVGGSGNGISLSVPASTLQTGRRKSAVELPTGAVVGGLLRPPMVPQGGRNRRYSDCLGLGLLLPQIKRYDRRGRF